MTRQLLEHGVPGQTLVHVRLGFSGTIDEVGRFRAGKLLELLRVIAAIVVARVRRRATLLYYPPAAWGRVPIWRDLAILLTTRWLFKHVVFHYHGAGLSEFIPRLSRFERRLCRLAYGKADCAIVVSELNPPDGAALGARRTAIVPLGIEDAYSGESPAEPGAPPRVLYVGAIRRSKGVMVLLKAARMMSIEGMKFELRLAGDFASVPFRDEAAEFVTRHNLEDHVHFLGPTVGQAKWEEYSAASVFCFPSFYAAESFGVVVLEAMQFGLPVVATRWRGIPALVRDGESGFLVPIRDEQAVAESLTQLLADENLAMRMGRRGRELYVEQYTLDAYLRRLGETLADVRARAC